MEKTFPRMASIVERNIHSLVARRQEEEQAKTLQDRIADRITVFAGSMRFVYLHLIGFGLWIVLNAGWFPQLEFDPSFVMLAMFASVEAIFLSTFVLITQNRMSAQADRRADLDLQVSLLAEHEVTRVISLLSAIAERLGVNLSNDPELRELKRDVDPEQVLDKIEQTQQDLDAKSEGQ
jgi:uncharacterized membrane protein